MRAYVEAVDPSFYEFTYGPLPPGTDAAVHYAAIGWREGRDPNPWFCTRRYLQRHPSVARSETVPLLHFLERGEAVDLADEPCEHALPYYERVGIPSHAIEDDSLRRSLAAWRTLTEQYEVVESAFDADFYRAENPHVADKGIDPLFHFLLQGWHEGRDPNDWFSLSAYCEAYPDVGRTNVNPFYDYLSTGRAEGRESRAGPGRFDPHYYLETNADLAHRGVNPLTHFIARGWSEGRAPNALARKRVLTLEAADRSTSGDPSGEAYVIEALERAASVTILLAATGASASERSVQAIVRNTTSPAELVLAEMAGDWNAALARALQSGNDLVLLERDVVVGPRWLENLRLAAYRRPTIGIVSALWLEDSTDAGFAVADRQDAVLRFAAQTLRGMRPRFSGGVGKCTLFKHALMRALSEAGEEHRGAVFDDAYCERALLAGWEHVVDGATLVIRAERASAEDSTSPRVRTPQLLRSDHLANANARSSASLEALQSMASDIPVAAIVRDRVRVAPRVLHVLHGWGLGGTTEFALDLIRGFGGAIEGYVLSSTGDRLALHDVYESEMRLLESFDLTDPVRLGELHNATYRSTVFDILTRYGFELVHVQHLMGHQLDLLEVAAALNLPVVITCHDYYFGCPNYLLLDDAFTFCDGVCTDAPGTCNYASPWLEQGPALRHRWVHDWRRHVTRAFRSVDAVVVPSRDAESRMRRLLPVLDEGSLTVIEHGVDLPRASAARPPTPGEKVRLLFTGYIGRHKGAQTIAALHAADAAGRLELHFLGQVAEPIARMGVHHGEYRRSEVVGLIERIGPAFVGLLSIFPETYSYTLSEAWLAGVPVIGTNLGAIGERIHREKGGWTFDLDDVGNLYRGILAIADDPIAYRRGLLAAQSAKVRSLQAMQVDYAALYQSIARRRRTLTNR